MRKSLTLQEHQEILYEILYMVDDFCKAHDINYFLDGGSLLGAIRHQGIIPWDDDIDIGMLRSDYERFIRLFHDLGCEGFLLYEHRYVSWFRYPFAKVGKKQTLLFEDNDVFNKVGLCINIDVFPFDGLPGDRLTAIEYFQEQNMKIRSFVNRWSGDPKKRFIGLKSKLYYACFHWPLLVNARLEKLITDAQKYSTDYAEFCANLVWGPYGDGQVQKQLGIKDHENKRFGSRLLPVPVGWDQYLSDVYGDYMTPPSISERRGHIDGNSYILYSTK